MKKHLFILHPFEVKPFKFIGQYEYTFRLYASEGGCSSQYITADTIVFSGYDEFMDYILNRTLKYFGTTKGDYHTISYQD